MRQVLVAYRKDINVIVNQVLYDKGGIDSEFLEKYITKKYKNKLIILDNASSYFIQNLNFL